MMTKGTSPSLWCRWCGEADYRTVADGADEENFGQLQIKNLLGRTQGLMRWKVLQCPRCGHVQEFLR